MWRGDISEVDQVITEGSERKGFYKREMDERENRWSHKRLRLLHRLSVRCFLELE